MAKVVLEQVTKRFHGHVAVKGVDLEIADGEFMVFVGPSGCGKSTTLRMIAGLEPVTEGEIYIGERRVTTLEPKDRQIAMVFQNYALYPHKTVYDNLAFGLRIHKVAREKIDRQVRWASEILGLEELLHRKPKQLSGGQMQRVALGRAIVREPDVFLLDEPLSNLDAKLRVKMREEIAKLHAKIKTSMVYVTHDQVEAMTLGDRIVVMHDGLVQQVGAPLELYDSPQNLFVAGFIGSPEMNLITGKVEAVDGTPTFVSGTLRIPLSGWVPRGSGPALKPGRDVILGIRPEHLTFEEEGRGLTVEVDVVERMGAQSLIIGRLEGIDLRMFVDRDDELRVGDRKPVGLHLEDIHLFDAQSELAISSLS